MSTSPDPVTVEALLDTTWLLASAEESRTEGLDRKATSLATFASVVLSLTATLGRRLVEGEASSWTLLPYLLSLAALGASVVLAVRVLLPKEHLTLGMAYLERFPKWSEILKPPEQVRGETMTGLIEAIARERKLNRSKAKGVRWALGLLVFGLFVVLVDAAILTAQQVIA